ncbi:hypothetical protein BZA77DRAFT_289835 [Pyronema omphalodes]|nr:hypothetical protein BZA77DRAFT_289835 [Pyronema omphalodes]
MALSGLDSLQSLSDALEQYLLTRSPAAKKYHDSIDRSNRKTRDDPEREIIKKRIAGRRTEKAKWGAGCTTRYQSADEEFGHLRWERDETPHGSDSEPDEKEDDEQLRVLLGYVRPPEDDNYDDIPKLEYDEEDEEAEIYENYDSGNEGDDEDERLHKKGRWAALCGMMEGLICDPESSTGPVTTAITPGAPNSTVLAPVQNVTAPQNSGIPSSSLPPAISSDFGSSLFSTGQNHDSTASQQSFPDDLNSQFGFIITRSEPGVPNPIPTFPPMENLPVPTSAIEIATHISTFPPLENLAPPTFTTEIANPITTYFTMENIPLPAFTLETAQPSPTFPSIEHPPLQTSTVETGSFISIFPPTENFPSPIFTIETGNHITAYSTIENLPPPISATEPSVITNTSFVSSSTITPSENATEPSAIFDIETDFDISPGLMASPTIAIDPSAAAATVAAQDLLLTNPAPNSPPQIVSSIPQETHFTSTSITTQATKAIEAIPSPSISIIPSAAAATVAAQDSLPTNLAPYNPLPNISLVPEEILLTSTPLTTETTQVTSAISTATAVPRATSLNPDTHPIPRRPRIAPIRRPLTPDHHRRRVPKALTEEDKIPRGELGTLSQEDDQEYLSGKRKRGDQDTGLEEVNTWPVKKINGGMKEIRQDVTKPDGITSRGTRKRVRWDDDVVVYEEDTRAPKRSNTVRKESLKNMASIDGVASRQNLKRVRRDENDTVYEEDTRPSKRLSAGMEEIRQDVTKLDGIATRSTLKRVRRDEDVMVHEEGTRAPKRANTGREETRRDVVSGEKHVSRGTLKKVRWDDDTKVDEASTGASKRLNPPRKEGRQGDAVKLDGICGRGILKRKREEDVEEVGKNHIVRSMVDTRATKRANLREEESWGLLKMLAQTVRRGWRFVVGLKNRIWR